MREANINRKTKETEITLYLNIDGNQTIDINTGIGFFDHMLTLVAFHGGFDLTVHCKGDIVVDDHHTIEDVGIALGQAFLEAIGDKIGMTRYGHIYLPMDECLSRLVLDISNRPYLYYQVESTREKVGTMDTQMVEEFFRAFVNEARLTLHIELLYGRNDHHKLESIFKGFGRVLKEASKIVGNQVVSSKGVL